METFTKSTFLVPKKQSNTNLFVEIHWFWKTKLNKKSYCEDIKCLPTVQMSQQHQRYIAHQFKCILTQFCKYQKITRYQRENINYGKSKCRKFQCICALCSKLWKNKFWERKIMILLCIQYKTNKRNLWIFDQRCFIIRGNTQSRHMNILK